MKVKKNDTVLVITGKDAGKTGKVLSAFPKENRVVVDGINLQKKSKKARSAKETSGIVEQAGPIDASNVMVICPKCGKAVRVHHKEVDGKNVRVCPKCGALLDAVADVKAEAKVEKKATKKVETETAEKPAKKTTKKAVAEGEEKPAKKTTKKANKAE